MVSRSGFGARRGMASKKCSEVGGIPNAQNLSCVRVCVLVVELNEINLNRRTN